MMVVNSTKQLRPDVGSIWRPHPQQSSVLLVQTHNGNDDNVDVYRRWSSDEALDPDVMFVAGEGWLRLDEASQFGCHFREHLSVDWAVETSEGMFKLFLEIFLEEI
jgi:hypothetical protein